MPNASNVQTSWLGGEWSALAQGLLDDPLYKKGMNRCLNIIPVEEESAVRRSGFQLAGLTRQGAHARIMSFPVKQTNPYDLEFTDGYLRMWQDAQLVTEEDTSPVVSISTADPAVVELATAVNWASDDYIRFTMLSPNAARAVALLTNRVFKIIRLDSTHVALLDGITNETIDGSALSWTSLLFVRAEKVREITTPYTDQEWEDVRKVQRQNELLLLHHDFLPRVVTATVSDTWFASFALTTADYTDGPYLDAVNGLSTTAGYTLTPSGTSGSINLTISDAAAINDGQGFLATDVGRLVRMFSAGTTWTWAQITARTSATVAVATVRGVNLASAAAMYGWRMGAYSDTTGYPTCGCYADGRIWLGGAIENRFDASMSNRPFDFTPTAAAGTVADNNAITYTFNSSDTNQINWMSPVAEGVSAGTLAGEWIIRPASSTAGLTPTNITADNVTAYGSAFVEPCRTGLTTVFVQKYQRKLLEFLADGSTNKYFAPNLSKYAKHLTKTGIKEIAYQEELAPVVWARTGDGRLIGSTYKRVSMYSSQTPLFNAWHRHTLGSANKITSLTTGPTTDGLLDRLTIITHEETTGLHQVEIMRPLFQEDDVLQTSWFVDKGIVPSCGEQTDTGIRFFGLWALNGQTVACMIGGIDCGDLLVQAGYMDVPWSAALTYDTLHALSTAGTDYGDVAVSIDDGALTIPAVVGFSFLSQGQRLRPVTAAETGAANGPGFGKTHRNHKYAVLLTKAQGVSFGTDFDRLTPANFKDAGGTPYPATTLFSGVYKDTLRDNYTYDGMLAWQVSRPYPATVNALGGFLATQDT